MGLLAVCLFLYLLDIGVAHHLVRLLKERGREVLHLGLEVLPQPRQLRHLLVPGAQRTLQRGQLVLQLPDRLSSGRLVPQLFGEVIRK